MAKVKQQARRQPIRAAALLLSLLLFPITMNYLSPYLIIDSASQGIINASFISFVCCCFLRLLSFLAAPGVVGFARQEPYPRPAFPFKTNRLTTA